MPRLRAAGALVTGALFGALLGACSTTPEAFPGSGPGGKPMRTATETAVGLPPAASPRVYPLNARGPINLASKGTDPYSWLENLDSPEAAQWVKSQDALAQPRLASLPARAWFVARLTQLSNSERYGVPVRRGERYFYLHKDGSQAESALMVSEGQALAGRVLFDPNTLSAGGRSTLADFVPGVTGSVLAYAVTDGGWQRWRFRRTAEAADLPDTLRAMAGTGLSWARDDSGVYYTRAPALPDGRADATARALVYFHKLGTPTDSDVIAYQVSAHVTHVPAAQLTEDGHYLVVTLLESAGRNGVDLVDLRQPHARPAHLFASGEAHYGYLGMHGSELYFETTQQAPLGRIIAVDAREPATRRIVVPEGGGVLEQASYVGGSLIACYVEDAHSVVRVFERDGRPRGEVPLPGLGSVAGFAGAEADAETFFSYTDYLTPPVILRLDVAPLRTGVWHAPSPTFAVNEFITEQAYYTSRDGTRVPLYITRRRDVPRDGNQALVLYAGAGSPMLPLYRAQVQAWLELGGLYAEADLHAGDYDLSDARAVLENEQLAVDDLVAAAEYLSAEHYTRPARLGVYGRRGAAALIAAALLDRPELLGAALPATGPNDLRRARISPGAPIAWRAGFGQRNEAQELQALYGYPSAQGIRRNCYPPTLINASERDELIAPWYGYKLGAALQSAQSCGNPVLIRTEAAAEPAQDHAAGMQISDLADQWAFLANYLGVSAPASAPR
jgi:prolyl oligopeptidase